MHNERTVAASRSGAAALSVIGILAMASHSVSTAPATDLPLSLCVPESNTFSTDVNNPFFPLTPGQQWVFGGKEGPDNLGLRITVLDGTETFYKGRNAISTLRVEEAEWEDENSNGIIDEGEFVIETSRNYYAQTQDGTVCYFGEDVDIFQPGGSVSHEGAWRADDPGNAPGIFMPADPRKV